jgi:SNF2 family DNA or RNA helicase
MARADVSGDRIIVETTWNEKELIKQVPGARWDPSMKTWSVPRSWSSCIILRGVFGEALEVADGLNEWAWPMAFEMAERRAMRNRLEPEIREYPRLYPFQEVGAAFLRRTKETLLGDEMGTGKTVQACTALRAIPDDGGYPAIVICPNSVKWSWAQHVKDWTTGMPYVIDGGAVTREKILKAAAEDPYAIVIVNFDALRTLSRQAGYGSIHLRRCRECDKKTGEEGLTATRCQVHPKPLNKIPFKTVIIDEAHKIKNPQAQQTRAVWAIAHSPAVKQRWAMTGTPIANHPGDLWSILHAIRPTDFPTRTHYVDRFCLQSWNAMGGLDIVGLNPATREEFYSIVDPAFRRVRKDTVLTQLPPKVRAVRWTEMVPKQKRMYDEFEDSLAVLDENGRAIVATNALVANLRRMQLSSASIATINVPWTYFNTDTDDAHVRMVEPSPKLDALEDILEELEDKQVAVCAFHRQLVELAAARLTKAGITFGMITGGQTVYERDLALRQFQAGQLRVLLFTISAGGTGLTMTAADTLVFLQRSWSMVDNKQAEDRIHRIGAEKHESITIIDIVTRDSVEEDQIGSLTEKMMRLEEITRDRQRAANDDDRAELDRQEDAIMGMQL